jgi:transcriptional regulator with XRE-family HTH domain
MNENEINKYVGNKIREFRKRRNLTQKELGEKIGVKHNTISAYENGTNSPEQSALFKIARALDIKVDDLFPSTTEVNVAEELERALHMAKDLRLNDIQLLKALIEKTLSLDEDERDKFLKSVKFAIDYYNNIN